MKWLEEEGFKQLEMKWNCENTERHCTLRFQEVTSLKIVFVIRDHMPKTLESDQISSVLQSCLTLCCPMDHSPSGPSPTPRASSNSCPLSQWCHPTISSSLVPFSSCLQSFPASRSLQMNQFFTSGGQSIGVSDSASVLPMNIQHWFPFWRMTELDK